MRIWASAPKLALSSLNHQIPLTLIPRLIVSKVDYRPRHCSCSPVAQLCFANHLISTGFRNPKRQNSRIGFSLLLRSSVSKPKKLSDWPEAMGLWFRSSEYEKKRKAWQVLSAKTAAIGLESCLTGYRRSELDRAHSLKPLKVLTDLTGEGNRLKKEKRKMLSLFSSPSNWSNVSFMVQIGFHPVCLECPNFLGLTSPDTSDSHDHEGGPVRKKENKDSEVFPSFWSICESWHSTCIRSRSLRAGYVFVSGLSKSSG